MNVSHIHNRTVFAAYHPLIHPPAMLVKGVCAVAVRFNLISAPPSRGGAEACSDRRIMLAKSLPLGNSFAALKPPPPLVANSRKNFCHQKRAAAICHDRGPPARQPECRCPSRARRQRPLSSTQARVHCGMPRALPPRSSVHRGACCWATLATCPANSCRPLLPAAPPPPLPLVRRRRPPRAPITCSTRVIVRSPCSGAANPWSAWRGCASAPMLAPSPLNPLALRAASSTSLQPCRGSLPATPPHAPVPAPILLPPTWPAPAMHPGRLRRRLQAPSSRAQPV
jgi:hypothetical protein